MFAGEDRQASPEARLRHAMQGKAAGRHGGALLSQLQAFQLLPGHVLAERVPCQGRSCEDGAVDLIGEGGSMAGRPRAATARDVLRARPWNGTTDLWALTEGVFVPSFDV